MFRRSLLSSCKLVVFNGSLNTLTYILFSIKLYTKQEIEASLVYVLRIQLKTDN